MKRGEGFDRFERWTCTSDSPELACGKSHRTVEAACRCSVQSGETRPTPAVKYGRAALPMARGLTAAEEREIREMMERMVLV